jgi:hypothetical protein
VNGLLAAVLIFLPRLAIAATGEPHLIEDRVLVFAPFGEVTPPPMPPGQSPGVVEEPPSHGAVVALTATGIAMLSVGTVFDVIGVVLLATSRSGGCLTGSAIGTLFGIYAVIVGVVLDIAGAVLLSVGLVKRHRRNEILSASNARVSYDPVTRSPVLGYAFNF